MGKVFLRIIVAGLILALGVLILLNTVFKQAATTKAYEFLSASLADDGQITRLNSGLDDMPEFNAKYQNFFIILDEELNTLKDVYPLLVGIKAKDDSMIKDLLSNIKILDKELQMANKKVSKYNETKTNADLDMDYYVEQVKTNVISALNSLEKVNLSLNNFLVKDYYKGLIFQKMFRYKLKTIYAKAYLTYAQEDYNSADSASALSSYQSLVNEFDTSSDTKLVKLNRIMDLSVKVDMEKVVIDFNKYLLETSADPEKNVKIIQFRDNLVNDLGLFVKA